MSAKSKRTAHQRIKDILESISNISSDVGSLSMGQYISDGKTIRASVASLTIIGEASASILNENLSEIKSNERLFDNLKGARAFRNFVTHEYSDIDPSIAWTVISKKLPEIKEDLEQLLSIKNDIATFRKEKADNNPQDKVDGFTHK